MLIIYHVLIYAKTFNFSELSIFFDAIDSLLFPMTWQHTIIPALPISRKGFLDAPTPYLIGLLLNPNIEPNLRRTNSTPIRKKKKSFSERKKSLSDSFIRSLSHSPRLESSFEESDGISLRSGHIGNDRPCSVPVISDSFDLTQENIEDIQFWSSFFPTWPEKNLALLVILLFFYAYKISANSTL